MLMQSILATILSAVVSPNHNRVTRLPTIYLTLWSTQECYCGKTIFQLESIGIVMICITDYLIIYYISNSKLVF